jgi:hypothetical protein
MIIREKIREDKTGAFDCVEGFAVQIVAGDNPVGDSSLVE